MHGLETGKAVQVYDQKEEVALEELKNRLRVGENASKKVESSSGEESDIHNGVWYSAMEEFLLRFLRSKNFDVLGTIEKLRQRRSFEKTLPGISITPAVTSILRSGAVSVLGNDFEDSQVLLVNLEDLKIPVLDPSETQRLFIVLLEYMQSLCMMTKPPRLDVAVSESCPTDTPIGNVYRSYIHTNTGSGAPSRSQKLTLLVNKSDAPFEIYSSVFSKITALSTILDKYYPCFLSRVLVLESDLSARESLDVNLKHWLGSMNCAVHVVDISALKCFLPEKIIPESLGGTEPHQNSVVSFPEAVLQHWDALTSTIKHQTKITQGGYSIGVSPTDATDYLASSSWPLYLSPLFAMSPNYFIDIQRSLGMHAGSCGINLPIDLHGINFETALKESPTSVESSLEVVSTLYSIGPRPPLRSSHLPTDDSIYSFSSGDNRYDGFHFINRPEIKDDLYKGVLPEEFMGTRELERIREDPGYAVQALKCERDRRLAAEQRLYMAEVGFHLDPHHASPVERRLAELHQELNLLATDVLSRAKAASEGQEPPSLVQLLDYTLTALETAANLPEEVSIASLMEPRQRDPNISGCCFMM
ncbi:unnamed protein product [Phytomonas sp. EM1]|nr:unnamed protein product [Phytomonas sp. EM1]|eukprot:CCW61962.1 unnamed protein product [Phytomonas sp. isolate EM1]